MTDLQPKKRFKLLAKKGFENSGKTKKPKALCPPANSIHKLSMTSMVWIISTGQLGCLSGCAAFQLLHTCSLAEYEKLQIVLDL